MSRLRHPFGHSNPRMSDEKTLKFFSITARFGDDEMDRVKSCCGGQRIVRRSCQGELLESES